MEAIEQATDPRFSPSYRLAEAALMAEGARLASIQRQTQEGLDEILQAIPGRVREDGQYARFLDYVPDAEKVAYIVDRPGINPPSDAELMPLADWQRLPTI